MKNFILGVIVALIVCIWIALVVAGVISIKTVILVPVEIVVGILLAFYKYYAIIIIR